MTPLIDCTMLLLIFYIVTTAFVDRELELQLPESAASAIPEERKKLTIEIGRQGELALDGERVTLSSLSARLDSAAAAHDRLSVEVRADTLVAHGRVVEVLGMVKQHGISEVGIAVKQKPESG